MGILLLVCLGLTTFILVHDPERALLTQNIENALEDASIPPLTIDNTTYVLSGGRVQGLVSEKRRNEVARLAYITAHTARDPIFAFEGLDTTSFSTAIGEMESSLKTLEPFFTEEEFKNLQKSLYPFSFLNRIVALEDARRTLINAPSMDGARTYNHLLQATITEYLSNLTSITQLFSAYEDSKTAFGYLGGTTDVHAILSGLHTLQAAAERALEGARERSQCLEASICTNITLPPFVLEPLPYEEVGGTKDDTILDRVRVHRDLLAEYYKAFEQSDEVSLPADMPLFALRNTSCYPEVDTAFFGMFRVPYIQGTPLLPEYLNDLFFYDTDKTSGQSPYFAWLKDQGIRFRFHTGTAPYMCPESGLIRKRISRLVYLHQTLQDAALSSQKSEHGDVVKLLEHANTLKSADIVNETDAHTFLMTATNLLNQYGEAELGVLIGENVTKQLIAAIHVWNQGTYLLADDMQEMTAFTLRQPTILAQNGGNMQFYLMLRHYISILFMPYNDSVNEEATQFELFNQQRPFLPERHGYVTYETSALKDMATEDVLELMIHGTPHPTSTKYAP